mmetsp:Transcript_8798/g.28002  ORF Transcript_8798/g.28002 Transcript_8798/m.28002 type:complete len:323 (+) Transcript_8798:838-1806(+)
MSCPSRGECVGSAAASGTMVPRRPAPWAAALAAAREAAAREAARETARPAGGARSGAGSASTALMASGGASPALATTHASSSSAGEPPSRGSTDRAAPRGGGRLAGRAAFLAGGGLLGGGLLALAAAAPSPPYFRTTRRLAWSESNRSSVSAVTPSHLNAGLAVDACRTFWSMRIEQSTLQMSYSRRTLVFIAPTSGSMPPRSCSSSERAACSSEIEPVGVLEACMKSPMNLTASSRIDRSLRARSSRCELPAELPATAPPFSFPLLSSSASSTTSGLAPGAAHSASSLATHPGRCIMPHQVYRPDAPFSTTSSDSSTLTMS